MRKPKADKDWFFYSESLFRHTNVGELLHISESIALPQAFKLLSCICQWPSRCPGFLQQGELGLITSCRFWVPSNFAPSRSNVSRTILDNTREGKRSGGRRGYQGIWISQETERSNCKGLRTIPVTSGFFFSYWLAHRCWPFPQLFPTPLPSLFLVLPKPSFLPSPT